MFQNCDDTVTEQKIDGTIIPATNVSFQTHIQPVFTHKCNFSGCHNEQSRAGNLALTTRSMVTADPSIVFPGEPQNSRLVWAIQRSSGASPMPPPGYPALIQNQVDGIITWIREGAKNN
jgi:hypothetical protein